MEEEKDDMKNEENKEEKYIEEEENNFGKEDDKEQLLEEKNDLEKEENKKEKSFEEKNDFEKENNKEQLLEDKNDLEKEDDVKDLLIEVKNDLEKEYDKKTQLVEEKIDLEKEDDKKDVLIDLNIDFEKENNKKENVSKEKNETLTLTEEKGKSHGLIDSDKLALIKMGYDKDLVDIIYKNVYPVNIDEALDYLYKNEYNNFIHSYISSSLGVCAICEKSENFHYKSREYTKEKEALSLKLESPHLNYNGYNSDDLTCEICSEDINFDDLRKTKIKCKHKFCSDCWFEYLKEKINNGKVYKLTCMKHECTQILDEKFIKEIIGSNDELLKKYEKFLNSKKLLDSNKKIKFCPFPDCDGYAEKKGMKKYVKCNYGHEFCFVCGQKPHGWKACSKMIDKGFEEWKSHTLVKRCPYCQYWTEKQDGCNHMTCSECNFQWCWVCEQECVAGHYKFGRCRDLQFSDVYSKEDSKELLCKNCGIFCCISWIIMKIAFLIIYLTAMPILYLIILTIKDDDDYDGKDYNDSLFIVFYITLVPFFICYEVITICYVAVLSVPAFIICPYYRFLRYVFYGKIFGKLFSV